MFWIHRPSLPLACSIDLVWYNDSYFVEHRRERALPSGQFQIIIDLSGGFDPLVVGMRSEYTVLETSALQHIMSVVFRAGGTRQFLDVPADDFYNGAVPLEQVWGAEARSLRQRLLDAPAAADKFRVLEKALLQRRADRLALHPAVRFALERIEQAPHIRSVLAISKECGLSRRRFAQLFREQVGITPKLHCRVHRFQRVVQRIAAGAPVDWADVAVAGGYCDQAHLAHEFRAFSGITPGDYLASDRPSANHVAMA